MNSAWGYRGWHIYCKPWATAPLVPPYREISCCAAHTPARQPSIILSIWNASGLDLRYEPNTPGPSKGYLIRLI